MKCLFCSQHKPCLKRDDEGRACASDSWDYTIYERDGKQVMVCQAHQPLTKEHIAKLERNL